MLIIFVKLKTIYSKYNIQYLLYNKMEGLFIVGGLFTLMMARSIFKPNRQVHPL